MWNSPLALDGAMPLPAGGKGKGGGGHTAGRQAEHPHGRHAPSTGEGSLDFDDEKL